MASVNIPHVRSGLTLDNQVKVLLQTNLPILFWDFNSAPHELSWASVLPRQTLNYTVKTKQKKLLKNGKVAKHLPLYYTVKKQNKT